MQKVKTRAAVHGVRNVKFDWQRDTRHDIYPTTLRLQKTFSALLDLVFLNTDNVTIIRRGFSFKFGRFHARTQSFQCTRQRVKSPGFRHMICIKQNRQANEKMVYWRYVMSLEEKFQPLTSRLLWLLQPEAITQFFQNKFWGLGLPVQYSAL